jgi:hypothetical protein
VAGDLLAVADISASESKKITVTDFLGKAVTLIADATIPNAKIVFGSASIPGSALQAGAVDATQLAAGAVTAAKLGNESTVDLVTSLPASGAFTGQFALDTDDSKAYIWDGSSWVSFKAAGSVNSVVGSSAGLINITVTTSGDTVTITTSLDDTTGAAEFLGGPTGNAGAVGYRPLVGTDLPTATTSAKGGVIVNGEGLRMDGNTIEVDNDLTASAVHHVVTYSSKGLIAAGRAIQSGDLPVATTAAKGAVIVGTGLSVDGTGLVNHANTVTTGSAPKVSFDAQGHVTAALSLDAADIPNLDTAKITTGTFDAARIGTSTITGAKLANYAISKIGDTTPTADSIGQFFFNPLSRDLFLWDGNVYQPIGISVGEIVFAGTFDASLGSGTGLVDSVTAEGTALGLIIGQALPAASTGNSSYYLVVSEAGTITTGNAPHVALTPPDIVLSNGTTWTEIDVSQTITAQVASNVSFTPTGSISATNVQVAIQELDTEKLPLAGGTITGNLEIGTAGSLSFEGATPNTFETTLAVVDPTADQTITLPDITGTVVTTGDTGTVTSTMLLDGTILNEDINASAAIAYSKLATLTSANIIVGSSANVATSTAVTGDINISNTGVTAIVSDVIVNADINASAAIADTKLATIATAGKVSNSATTAASANTASAIVTRDASGNFTAGTITAAVTGAASSNVLKAGDTMTGNLTLNAQSDLRFADSDSSHYIALQAPAAIPSNVTLTLPAADGTSGQFLSTDGSGTLSFATPAGGGGGASNLADGSAATPSLNYSADTNTGIFRAGNDLLAFSTGGTERAQFDASGRLLIGTSSTSAFDNHPSATVPITTTENALRASNATISHNSGSATAGGFLLGRSRSGSVGGRTIVQSNDSLGRFSFQGADGSTEFVEAAEIRAEVDGTPGANDMPGRLVFSTTADGAGSPTQRMRITQAGFTKITSTGSVYQAAGTYHEMLSGSSSSPVLFCQHTSATGAGVEVYYTNTINDTAHRFFWGYDNSTTRFEVRSNGGIGNFQANNVNLSDINTKKDISPAADTWNCVKEWEIVNYRYKDQPDAADLNLGVIAQQVAESCPEVIAVFQEAKEATEDQPAQEERLGVKEQQMYWMAIKALQEAQSRIEQLESKVAALETP